MIEDTTAATTEAQPTPKVETGDVADTLWTIVKSDDKKRARLNCMQHFLSSLPYPSNDTGAVRGPDTLIVCHSSQGIGTSAHILGASLHPDLRRGNGVTPDPTSEATLAAGLSTA